MSDGLHALQHLSFAGAAVVFWWSLRRPGASAIAVLSLFATALHATLLGALLTLASSPWYDPYLETAARFGLTPLEDQQLGGITMGVEQAIVFFAIFAYWFFRFLAEQEEQEDDELASLDVVERPARR